MRQSPGIKDVAARAGVSIKTVSRVVNGITTVMPDTRLRVEQAISELNYVPNPMARALKSGIADAIGVVIDTIDDVFFASLVSAIEQRAEHDELGLVIASTGFSAEREQDQLLRLAGQRVRGIILSPVGESHDYLQDHRPHMPVVMVDRSQHGYDSVTVDDEGATREGVEGLIALGHRRIALVGRDERYQTIVRRVRGFAGALADHGLTADADLMPGSTAETETARLATLEILAGENVPTAIFAANSRAGIGVVTALHEVERTDIAFISFGDFSLADVLKPAVSCIDQDPYRIGNAAFDRLMALIADPALEPKDISVETELHTRGSGEILPPAGPAAERASAEERTRT
ncbi:LacI family DNA-binding transcriptional regulator [Okibacterium endophyticum]